MTDEHSNEQPDEHMLIARQLSVFLKRAGRAQASALTAVDGQQLDRAAYSLLGHLMQSGPARMSSLAAELSVDLSVVSRQIAALEANGMVTRTADPADRRASVIAPTDHGRVVFTRHRARFVAVLREVLADWTSDERHEFARLFARFNEAMVTAQERDPWVRR